VIIRHGQHTRRPFRARLSARAGCIVDQSARGAVLFRRPPAFIQQFVVSELVRCYPLVARSVQFTGLEHGAGLAALLTLLSSCVRLRHQWLLSCPRIGDQRPAVAIAWCGKRRGHVIA
jgi:hypothetical protein